MCEGKTECWLQPKLHEWRSNYCHKLNISMNIFSVAGNCRETNLWLTYSCDAGGIDQTTGNIKVSFFGIVSFMPLFLEIQFSGG